MTNMNRVSPLIINKLLKFERNQSKTVACIMVTKFHRQSPKGDLDLWTGDSKTRGIFFSPTTCWPLTPQYKINRVPPLIIQSLHVKFESDCAKKCSIRIVPIRFYIQSAKMTLTLQPKFYRVLPLIINILHHWCKTVDSNCSYYQPNMADTEKGKIDFLLYLLLCCTFQNITYGRINPPT